MKYLALLILFTVSNTQALPDYEPPVMEMSSSMRGGFNAPPVSLFINSTPSINKSRNIAIPLTLIEGQETSGVWAKIDGQYSLPYYRHDGYKISNFNLSENNKIHFTVHDDFFLVDVLALDLKSTSSQSLKSKLLKDGMKNINSLYTTESGLIFKGFNPTKAHYGFHSGVLTSYKREDEIGISYLFAPGVSSKGYMAFKERLGERGQWSETQPDRIIFQDKKNQFEISSDQNSRWVGFRNGVSVNNKKVVCFVGIDKNSKAHIVLSDGRNEKIIASEGGEIKSISYFTPVLIDNSIVAFRGVKQNGNHAVFVADANEIKVVLEQNQLIDTPEGKVRVYQGDHIPFGGNVGMNGLGDIVINSGISDSLGQVDLGRALITIYTK